MDLDVWVCLLAVTGAATGAGMLAVVLASLVARVGRRQEWAWLQTETGLCRRPWVASAASVAAAVTAERCAAADPEWRRGAWIPVIVSACWLLIRVVLVGESVLFHRLPIDVENNQRTRRSRTRVALLRRVVAVLVIVLGLAGSLTLLPELHSAGASLFASAGLAGIVAGLAAQTTMANMFAGMQLAFTDAVRIDDVVVVEGEWGWIEEITLTYVVVHIWDERRLVLPTNYFTTMPFQNWTRHQAQLLGSVILHLDYATPLTALREYAEQVIRASSLWDGKDWVLQVTSTTETTMVVRVLASAQDGPTSWDLCCEIREALLVFLQERHPQAMPVHRLLVSDQDHQKGSGQLDLTRIEGEQGWPVRSRDERAGAAAGPQARRGTDSRTQIPRRADLRRAERSAAERSAAMAGSGAPVPAPRRFRALNGPR